MRKKKRILVNLGYAIAQVNIIIADYLAAIEQDYHRALSNWQSIDLVALIFVHLLLIAIAFLIFNTIKARRIRKLLPYYYAIGYFAYFLDIKFYFILPILILISLDAIYYRWSFSQIITLNRSKTYTALIAMSLFFTASQYFKIISAPAIDHSCAYSKAQPSDTKPKTQANNIIFLLFDKLSYQELYMLNSTTQGTISDRFSAFKDFSSQAWNFHAAFSPYSATMRSIPTILGLDQASKPTDLLGEMGYQTHVFGNYLNYCDLLEELTSCKSYSWYHMPSKFDPFTTSTLRHLIYIPNAGHHFYKRFFFNKIKNFLDKRRGRIVQETMERDFFKFLDSKPTNSYIYMHFNVPHPPYVFSSQGGQSDKEMIQEYLSFKKSKAKDIHKRESYLANLDYTDKLLARIIAKLKQLDLYHDSIIIVTADHSFQDDPVLTDIAMDPHAQALLDKLKADPNYDGSKPMNKLLIKTHVPLIIKLPQQRSRQDSSSFVSNAKIFPNINNSLLDSNLEFDATRIEVLGDSLMRVPKKRKDFDPSKINNNKLIIKS